MTGRVRHAAFAGLLMLLVGIGACARVAAVRHAQAPRVDPGEARGLSLSLPLQANSVRFAVIGDSGTGGRGQFEIAERMIEFRQRFPFEFVIMLGDNLYGSEEPDDYAEKFETPYGPLLTQDVKFYASLGNHDEPTQRFYRQFNMDGKRYYTFTARAGSVRFFALDSGYMTEEQLEWLETELDEADEEWKIAFFHHPIYSSGGRHGPDPALRAALEPLFIKYGVDAVFAGHEHFYERLRRINGIVYFISGAAGKLRRGDIRRSRLTAKGYDQDLSFILVEIAGDALHFQTVSRAAQTVDSGVIERSSVAVGAVSR